MRIEELKSILEYAETDPKQDIHVKVKNKNTGSLANAKLVSYGTYTDGIVLNVEV